MAKRAQPDLTESVYLLYEHAALQGPLQFRARAAESCAQLLPFDGVLWGILQNDSPVPASIWRHRVRGSFLDDLEPQGWQDLLDALFEPSAVSNGVTLAALNPARSGVSRTLRDHFREAGIGQALALRCAHPARPMHSLILFLRRDGRDAFTSEESSRLRSLAPHLGSAMTLALRGLANIDQLLQSLGRPSRQSSGVLDDHGRLLEADDHFRALLLAHFPDWRGGQMPFPLPPLDRSGTEEPVVAGLHVRGTRNGGLTVIHLREVNPMDLLSPRERDVVRAIASGLTLKSIGKRLDISPSTVANHAARIYAKLGIHSRDRLVDMLKRLNRAENPAEPQRGSQAG